MYLLDTNACIQILNDTSPPLVQRLASHAPSEIRLCSIVKAELLYGARHSQRVVENLKLLAHFFVPFVSLPFNDRCAEQYGQIRAELAQAGTLIGPNDLLIAAIARAYDMTLVTHNVEEFGRVNGLRQENWEKVGI
jgi:tRNA(fMet)-specific endonuclease VapC